MATTTAAVPKCWMFWTAAEVAVVVAEADADEEVLLDVAVAELAALELDAVAAGV